MHSTFLVGQRSRLLLIATLCATLLMGVFAGTASAHTAHVNHSNRSDHKPLFKSGAISSPQQAMTIPDPNISWAIYASLNHSGEADYYTFRAPQNFKLTAQITIPAISSLQNFAPHLALIGPGLPTSTAGVPGLDGLNVPSSDGVVIYNATHAGATDAFYEPFTQTNYWNRQTETPTLTKSGTYYLAVFNLPTDAVQTGKYVLAVGTKEEFGPSDLLTFPATYIRVRQFTEAGVPLWAWIALGVIVLLIVLLVIRHRRRKARKARTAPSQAYEKAPAPTRSR